LKYPNPSTFEILLPTDIINVATIQLKNWMIPDTFQTFTEKNNNVQLEFTLKPIVANFTSGSTEEEIANSITQLLTLVSSKFVITITTGNYDAAELANEVQNRMNSFITEIWKNTIPSNTFDYTFFNVIWNSVSKKFIFVNTIQPFAFNNDSLLYKTQIAVGEVFNPCCNEKLYSSFSYYGLPAYLGFTQTLAESTICINNNELMLMYNSYSGLPTLSFTQLIDSSGNLVDVNFIVPDFSYTLLRTPEIFLDIQSFNCVDATKPYTNNRFTQTTNQGNGAMNSFLGKIPMLATSNSFASSNGGGDYQPTANFNPPLEKVRKFIISLRKHDGSLIDFGFNNWSISLNLESYIPTQNVKIIKTPF
jgi:hypothetical protein